MFMQERREAQSCGMNEGQNNRVYSEKYTLTAEISEIMAYKFDFNGKTQHIYTAFMAGRNGDTEYEI